MNHYWVRLNLGWDRNEPYTYCITAENESEAVIKALHGCAKETKVISVKIDRNYEHRQYWRAAWERAMKGLPDLPNGGGWGHLARLLGYKMYSTPRPPNTKPHYIGHTQTYCNLCRGSKPRNPWRAAKLLELADMH